VSEVPRTATVTTVTRTVILSITKENFALFFESAPEAISDFEIKLARYDVQLRSILHHPVGLAVFTEQLRREYSEENIEFVKIQHSKQYTSTHNTNIKCVHVCCVCVYLLIVVEKMSRF
jgi:CRP-like cAMP-binding protein